MHERDIHIVHTVKNDFIKISINKRCDWCACAISFEFPHKHSSFLVKRNDVSPQRPLTVEPTKWELRRATTLRSYQRPVQIFTFQNQGIRFKQSVSSKIVSRPADCTDFPKTQKLLTKCAFLQYTWRDANRKNRKNNNISSLIGNLIVCLVICKKINIVGTIPNNEHRRRLHVTKFAFHKKQLILAFFWGGWWCELRTRCHGRWGVGGNSCGAEKTLGGIE